MMGALNYWTFKIASERPKKKNRTFSLDLKMVLTGTGQNTSAEIFINFRGQAARRRKKSLTSKHCGAYLDT